MALKPWEEEKGKERKGLEGGRDGVVGTHSFTKKELVVSKQKWT